MSMGLNESVDKAPCLSGGSRRDCDSWPFLAGRGLPESLARGLLPLHSKPAVWAVSVSSFHSHISLGVTSLFGYPLSLLSPLLTNWVYPDDPG